MVRLSSAITGLLAILSVWLPVWLHYYAPTARIGSAQISRLRQLPGDAVLREADRPLAGPAPESGIAIRRRAAAALAGRLEFPGLGSEPASAVFAPRDLERGMPTWALNYASLGTADLFLSAYELDQDPRYLEAATRFIVRFSIFERQAWVPHGFLWNDHAVAARIQVLIHFWRLYRQSAQFEPEVAREVFIHLLRCRALLAKPSHFTVRTNHGVMQNVALLQIAAAFPGLPDEARHVKLAMDRLALQLPFYLSGEGVVLEHSAGYQVHGQMLLGMAARNLELSGRQVPAAWLARYRLAQGFTRELRLPDGSFPLVGNTGSDQSLPAPAWQPDGREAPAPACRRQGVRMNVYPVSGFALLKDCAPDRTGRLAVATQATIPWGNFIGHGHKLADEMSLLLWAHGRSWVSNVGYWPYGLVGHDEAAGWRGSNAPHLQGEPAGSVRNTRLLGAVWSSQVGFVDLARRLASGEELRRQVAYLSPDRWIVVDTAAAPAGTRIETLWTFPPPIRLSPGRARSGVSPPGSMRFSILPSDGMRIEHLRGSLSPFGGWMVLGRPQPTDALAVRFAAGGSPQVVFIEAGDDAHQAGLRSAVSMHAPDDWVFVAEDRSGRAVRLARFRDELAVSSHGHDWQRLRIPEPPDPSAGQVAIQGAFLDALQAFPPYREDQDYRSKVTLLLVALLLVQETGLYLHELRRRKVARLARASACLAWMAGTVYLQFFYFPA